MRKLVSLMLLGASWTILAGCEQRDSLPEPAEGLPQNETPRSEPNLDVDGADDVDPVEPADPGVSPGRDEPAGSPGDIGDRQQPEPLEQPRQPAQPPQPPQQ